MPSDKRRALVIGGGFSGLFAAKDLKEKFSVTVVDAKEFFEYTPGILRAYVKPAHFDALTFTLQTVVEHKMGVKFIWGEVKALNENKTAVIKPMFAKEDDIVEFDYCAICAGCNFGPFKKWGESLWFPVIHEEARKFCHRTMYRCCRVYGGEATRTQMTDLAKGLPPSAANAGTRMLTVASKKPALATLVIPTPVTCKAVKRKL